MIHSTIQKLMEDKKTKEKLFWEQIDEDKKEGERIDREFWEVMAPYLRKAQKSEYIEWLKGYLASGETPTEIFNFNFYGCYVLTKNINEIPQPYTITKIIVPEGINVNVIPDNLWVYFMLNYRKKGIVAIYKDTIIEE